MVARTGCDTASVEGDINVPSIDYRNITNADVIQWQRKVEMFVNVFIRARPYLETHREDTHAQALIILMDWLIQFPEDRRTRSLLNRFIGFRLADWLRLQKYQGLNRFGVLVGTSFPMDFDAFSFEDRGTEFEHLLLLWEDYKHTVPAGYRAVVSHRLRGLTMKETGVAMGLTESRVSQLMTEFAIMMGEREDNPRVTSYILRAVRDRGGRAVHRGSFYRLRRARLRGVSPAMEGGGDAPRTTKRND